jgi:hypothetical protein
MNDEKHLSSMTLVRQHPERKGDIRKGVVSSAIGEKCHIIQCPAWAVSTKEEYL